MSATESVQSLIDLLTEACNDAEKHERGVDAAGARLRKKLQQCVTDCKELRAEVQADRNTNKQEKSA